jgi:hypothetical protein
VADAGGRRVEERGRRTWVVGNRGGDKMEREENDISNFNHSSKIGWSKNSYKERLHFTRVI